MYFAPLSMPGMPPTDTTKAQEWVQDYSISIHGRFKLTFVNCRALHKLSSRSLAQGCMICQVGLPPAPRPRGPRALALALALVKLQNAHMHTAYRIYHGTCTKY